MPKLNPNPIRQRVLAIGLTGLALTGGLASAAPYFHSDFDEAGLGAITGLHIDTPSTSGPDSGTVTLDTANQTLDLTANAANTWTAREGAPIAWVSAPTVSNGVTWYVETQITHTDSPGGATSGYDQAGITFYSGTAGANPGSENTGAHESLFFGINDWDAWHHRIQGFVDNNPNVSVAASGGDDTFEYRVEVTENGAADLYNFFYREDPADPWTQIGPTDLSQDFNNSAVGLFLKSHNNNATASTEVHYLTIDVISVNGTDTDTDGLDDLWEDEHFGDHSGTVESGDLTPQDGTGDPDMDGADNEAEETAGSDPNVGDTDGDTLSDGDEINTHGTDPTVADTDGDGLNDGEEQTLGTDPTDADSDDDGWDDGAEVAAGTDPNSGTSVPTLARAPDIHPVLPMEKRDAVVVFNEIHYQPAGDDSTLEYIELHNQLAVDVDMSNWRLAGDVDFDFPEGTVISAGGYLVVAQNPAALAGATGHSGALGPFTGFLSNSGGHLLLYNNNRAFRTLPGGVGSPGEILDALDGRRIMDEIDYSDVSPWPVGADGSGATLAKRDPATGTPHPHHWAASVPMNGTPGLVNAAALKPSLAINELSATTDANFRVELCNYGTTAVSYDGMIVASSDPAHADYVLPAGTLASGAFLSIDAATLGFTPADNNRVFLYGAGRQALVDAARADDRGKARSPDGTGRWLRPDVATFGAVNTFDIPDEIVINEIFYHASPQRSPFAERDEEWVELHNRGAAPVDLTGWEISGGIGYSFPMGTNIPAGGYLVIAKDSAALALKHPAATILGDYSGRLGNAGDLVVLESPDGNPADEVAYHDDGKWHEPADGGGSSLELIDPDSDNRFAGAWAPSDESARSNWQTYTYDAIAVDDGIGLNVYHELNLGLLDAGAFLLDDVSVIEDPGGAAIEFIQNGDFESDTVGGEADKWRAIGTHGSHGNTVVVSDPDDGGNQCLHVVATGPGEHRHNKLETTFANSQQVVVGRTYRISFRAKFLGGSNQLNTRLYFNYLQRTTHLATPTTWGTPGLANSAAIANAGPVLSGLEHSPVVPDAGAPVTVTIDATDADGINDLTLFYSVDGGAFQNVAMTAGLPGEFSGTIPGQGTGDIVRFYVRGRDSSNATSFHPAAAAEGGAFYKVQDGYADTSGIRHNLRIVMAEADRQFLFLNTNRMSNDRMPVTIIEDETTAYYDVRLRLKASAYGRYNSGAYGFNLRFQPDRLFRGVHRTIAIERGSFKELLANALNNRAANPYCSSYDDVAYIITPTTGDRRIGMLHMARHTSTFLDSYDPDASTDGTLFNQELHYSPNGTTGGPEDLKIGNPYNHTNGQYDLVDRGADKEPYRWGFQIRSSRSRDDYSRLVALNQAFDLDGAALESALEPLIDIDQWMRTFAIMTLNGTDDVYSRLWEHNFRFYVRPDDGKVVVFQWDLDRAFRLATGASVTPTVNKQGDPVSVAKLFDIPRFRRLFDGHIDDLIQTTFNSTYVAPWASHLGSVCGTSLDYTSYLTNRANFVQSSLPGAVPFAITTNNGVDFPVTDSVVNLAGNAWVDVFSIQVNGVPSPITWTDADSWQITVPVHLGANPLTLTAINNRGTEVGSDSITVTNTGTVGLADAGNTIISELHYHPADPSAAEITAGFTDADEFEFVELTNTDPATEIDLTGVSFTDAVVFTFPAGTTLAPGGRLVVVVNQAAFEFRYGIGAADIAGTYSGKFSNGGEHVRLEAADASAIADFTYGEDAPWPQNADGDGYSLVFAGADPTQALDWRSSTAIDGTPGGTDSVAFGGGDLLAYSLAADPSGRIIDDTFVLDVRVNLAADDAIVQARFSTDLTTWTTAPADDLISRINHGDGTATLSFRAPLPPSTTPKQFGAVLVETR